MATADFRNEPTPDGSTCVRPQDMEWKPTRFEGNVFRSSAGF